MRTEGLKRKEEAQKVSIQETAKNFPVPLEWGLYVWRTLMLKRFLESAILLLLLGSQLNDQPIHSTLCQEVLVADEVSSTWIKGALRSSKTAAAAARGELH